MIQDKLSYNNRIFKILIILFSSIGLIACIAVLFPQVRQILLSFIAKNVLYKETSINQAWNELFIKFAALGVFFILLFNYIIHTDSGKLLLQKVKKEIHDCLSEINFRSFLKPSLVLLGVYLLGILTIIRANFSYKDDILRAAAGSRQWINGSRYISEVFSIFVHGDTNLTDISPIPQLLAILVLTAASVLLVYVLTRKITIIRLLACIPLGLSPYFLESLSFKFDSPYMALSILASIIPFLFITRRKAFMFVSVASLLIMCMSYQAASGIYMLIAFILCFQYWNNREKTNKDILYFFITAALSFCFSLLFYRFLLMKPIDSEQAYALSSMYPMSELISGSLHNIKNYAILINYDLGLIWKAGIVFVLIFFIIKSVSVSKQRKALSFLFALLVIVIAFILSYGIYSLLEQPSYRPCALMGFGVFLAIMCVYVVSDFKKMAIIVVLALNWCLFTFAFSYGNALADQARYAEFRIVILMRDLSASNMFTEDIPLQIDNSIEFTPVIKNIAKRNPVIERLVQSRLSYYLLDYLYFSNYFNYNIFHINKIVEANFGDTPPVILTTQKDRVDKKTEDFNTFDLPVVLDSYYHTIKSDGNRVLIILKH